MVRQYGFDSEEVWQWLRTLHIDWPLSVRADDSDGQTVGLLTMSRYRIEEEAETLPLRNPQLLQELNRFRYTAVFSFIVDDDFRGTSLNSDMLHFIGDELRRYDFVFVPVLRRLKTHDYWRRWGAQEFFADEDCKYYLIPHNDAVRDCLRRLAH